jgi:hypothetical protein
MSDQIRVCAEALKLALLVQAQKHSGSFETQHKTGDGKDITVTRGPGGQFVSPGKTAEPKKSFALRVEDLHQSIDNAIKENASKLKSALQSKPVTDFNNNFASQLDGLLGKKAGDAYRSAASSLPDAVTRSGMKLGWAANSVAQVVEKLPDVAKGAKVDPLQGIKFAGALAEEFAIAALGAMILSTTGGGIEGVAGLGALALGAIGAYHGAVRLRAMFDKLAEKGAQNTQLQKVKKELDQQIKEIETPAAEETPAQKAMSLSLGVSPKSAEKAMEALKASKIDPDAVRQALNRQAVNGGMLDKHSLRERVLELTALHQNPKKSKDDKTSIEWHVGIINSEIRYGAAIDQLLESTNTRNPEESEANYQKLISLIDKGETKSNIRSLDSSEVKSFENIPWIKERTGHLETKYPDFVARTQECIEAAQLFGKLTRQKLDVRVGFLVTPEDPSQGLTPVRGYQINFGVPKFGESFIHVGLVHDAKTLMFHELGHTLEAKLGNSAITHNYIKNRATSNKEVSVRDLEKDEFYGEAEKALPSDFQNFYTAKAYEGNSEVISMATQTLTSWQSLSLQAKQDRDHLLFGLYALDQ